MTRVLAFQLSVDLPKSLGRNLKRAQPRGMIEDLRGRDYFVSTSLAKQFIQPAPHRFRRTNRRTPGPLFDRGQLCRAAIILDAIHRRRKLSRPATNQTQEL